MTFADLHIPGIPLVVPNAWDAASAAILSAAGASAVATTSGGVAWSLGYPDGNAIPVDELVAAVGRIARVLRVPLSADIESGFSLDPVAVADVAARVHAAGAVGINIEDSWEGALLSPEAQAARVRAITDRSPGLFVNARLDAFLFGVTDPLTEVAARVGLLADAGAGAVFVPGVHDLAVIADVVHLSPLPVSVMAGVGAPTAAELASVGVSRISTGTDLADAAYGRLHDDATIVLNEGRFDALRPGYGYGALNALLAR